MNRPEAPEQDPCGVAVGDVGRGDQYGDGQAAGVDGDVPLATVDFLPRVVAAGCLRDGFGGLHRLGVHDHRDLVGDLSGVDPQPGAERVTDPLDHAGPRPAVEEPEHRAPGREVGRHRPPLDSVVDEVADRVHDLAPRVGLRPAARDGAAGRDGQQGLDQRPFGVGGVRRVAAGAQTGTPPSLVSAVIRPVSGCGPRGPGCAGRPGPRRVAAGPAGRTRRRGTAPRAGRRWR